MEVLLGAMPETIDVLLNYAKSSSAADTFFDALHNTKKSIRLLSIGHDYLTQFASDPASLDLTTKWLVKLPIYELEFLSDSARIPIQLLGVLHLVPMLVSLHLQTLGDCAGVALSECKSLRKLAFSNLFVGVERPKAIVQQVVDVVKGSKIEVLAVFVPLRWQKFPHNKLEDLVAASFMQHGWHEQHGEYENLQMDDYFVCRRRA
ncbi:hypothetical protein HDU81_001567 [Chytriomyces hyalinus]|nr:hypothetical protein HDU81_001567 [Chytriomyces hyalinus]